MTYFGQNSYFSNFKFSVFKQFYNLFTSKLGNLGCLRRTEVAVKAKNSPKNIIKVAKTPYFGTHPKLSPKTIGRFC